MATAPGVGERVKLTESDLKATQAPAGTKEPEVNKLFRLVMKLQASDLHLKVGQPPMMRLKGDIRRMDMRPLTQEDMERLLLPNLQPKHRTILDEEGGVDFSYVVGADECRFRVSLFRQRSRLSLVARRVNTNIPNFATLGLPASIETLCNYPEGLVILAGVTGSGKSTTIASMIDYINGREPLHILTCEDPIEFVFEDKLSYINQREIGLDCKDWHKALKDAVRQDPDVILVGELRDIETFEAAVHAAETGHLVFGTIHASSAGTTINRILDLFPPEKHGAIRQALANNLRAIVAQKLIKSIKPGTSRLPTNEIMIVNPTVRKLIAEGQDSKFLDAIRLGYLEGMVDFNENLRQLVERNDVDKAVALEFSPNPDQLKMLLKGIKVAAPGIL
ncbi:MAG: PilT/PilU family type 4a pilus ATPase [Planctomycetota bacterium]|jgi:twitching motility protein PilT